MAKEEQIPEEELEKQRRDQEREVRIKEEEDKEKEREKEKEKKKKEREKKVKLKKKLQRKKGKKDRKLISRMINFPFSMLLQASLLISIILFIINFFGNSVEILQSVLYSFYVFLVVFLGGGIVLTAIFYVLSERKEKELYERMENEKERIKNEEEAKKQEEQEILETALNDGADVEMRRQAELQKFRDAQARSLGGPKTGNASLSIDDMSNAGGSLGLPDEFELPAPDGPFDDSINMDDDMNFKVDLPN